MQKFVPGSAVFIVPLSLLALSACSPSPDVGPSSPASAPGATSVAELVHPDSVESLERKVKEQIEEFDKKFGGPIEVDLKALKFDSPDNTVRSMWSLKDIKINFWGPVDCQAFNKFDNEMISISRGIAFTKESLDQQLTASKSCEEPKVNVSIEKVTQESATRAIVEARAHVVLPEGKVFGWFDQLLFEDGMLLKYQLAREENHWYIEQAERALVVYSRGEKPVMVKEIDFNSEPYGRVEGLVLTSPLGVDL